MALVDFSNYSIGVSSGARMLTPNEGCFVGANIQNNTSKTITYIKFFLLNGNNNVASVIADSLNISQGWAENTTLFGRALKVNESVSPNVNIFTYMNSQTPKARSLIIDKLFVIVTFADKSQFSTYLALQSGSQLPVISGLWKPSITQLVFKRCTYDKVIDDEGKYILSTIKTSFASSEYKDRFNMTIKQYNNDNGYLMQTITINAGDSRLSQLYDGIVDSDMFFSSFVVIAKEYNYRIVVEIGDEYEKSTLAYVIPATFVNMHLSSAANGGVAFGKLSSATDAEPKFECYYPTIFYDNVKVQGNGMIENIRCGDVSPDTFVVSGGQRRVTVQFGVTYSSIPIVTACAYSTALNDDGLNIACCIKGISTTAFTAVLTNNGSTPTSVGLTWIAYGKLGQ